MRTPTVPDDGDRGRINPDTLAPDILLDGVRSESSDLVFVLAVGEHRLRASRLR
jgi:hypothetical protein